MVFTLNIYQHFREEERLFIDRVLHWKSFVEDSYSPKLVDFLDPREQYIVQSVIGTNSFVQVSFYGGFEESERKRAIIYPDYFSASEEDYQIQLFEINYPRKFVKMEHPKILGSLMSLGLKREKFGDILISHDRAQFFSAKEVGEYIKQQLTSIGRTPVSVRDISLQEAIPTKENWTELVLTVSSLRLDNLLSSIYSLSRQKAQTLIKQGLVKVNWKIVEEASFQCEMGDVISARKFGRSKLMSIDGKTKKDKWKIIVGKQE